MDRKVRRNRVFRADNTYNRAIIVTLCIDLDQITYRDVHQGGSGIHGR